MLLIAVGLTRTSVAGSIGELPCFAETMMTVDSSKPSSFSAETIAPLTGGFLDAAGTPSTGLQATLEHTDASIRAMVSALNDEGLLESPVIIVSAKHGNS